MIDIEKVDDVFKEILKIEDSELKKNPKYGQYKNWDSVGHITLIVALEDAFNIEFEPNDYLEIDSYSKALDILNKKFDRVL